MNRLSTPSRFTLLSGLVGVVLVATWRLTAGSIADLTAAAHRPDQVLRAWTLDRLVIDLASALLLVATAGLALMLGLAATAALATHRAPNLAARCRRVTPVGWRRLVAILLGVGLAAPLTNASWASADEHRTTCRQTCPAPPPSLRGLRLPDLPLTPLHQHRPPAATAQIVVRPGDSLWRIAEQRCGSPASDARVAALTDRLYRLNRATIGSDPDLIFPGMTLLAPEGKT